MSEELMNEVKEQSLLIKKLDNEKELMAGIIVDLENKYKALENSYKAISEENKKIKLELNIAKGNYQVLIEQILEKL